MLGLLRRLREMMSRTGIWNAMGWVFVGGKETGRREGEEQRRVFEERRVGGEEEGEMEINKG